MPTRIAALAVVWYPSPSDVGTTTPGDALNTCQSGKVENGPKTRSSARLTLPLAEPDIRGQPPHEFRSRQADGSRPSLFIFKKKSTASLHAARGSCVSVGPRSQMRLPHDPDTVKGFRRLRAIFVLPAEIRWLAPLTPYPMAPAWADGAAELVGVVTRQSGMGNPSWLFLFHVVLRTRGRGFVGCGWGGGAVMGANAPAFVGRNK